MPGRHVLPRLISFKAKQTVRDAYPRSRAAAQKSHLSWTMLPPRIAAAPPGAVNWLDDLVYCASA
jgi:hypothetical protein